MRIDAIKFGTAWAAAAALLWILCSLVVFAIPGPSVTMSGHMMHSDMGRWAWSFSLGGVLAGLLLWALFAFIFGWLIGVVYNAMGPGPFEDRS